MSNKVGVEQQPVNEGGAGIGKTRCEHTLISELSMSTNLIESNE